MAGSYRHCRDENGKFYFDCIDNMKDAYEACEMMFDMIQTLSCDDLSRIEDAEYRYYLKFNPGLKRDKMVRQ